MNVSGEKALNTSILLLWNARHVHCCVCQASWNFRQATSPCTPLEMRKVFDSRYVFYQATAIPLYTLLWCQSNVIQKIAFWFNLCDMACHDKLSTVLLRVIWKYCLRTCQNIVLEVFRSQCSERISFEFSHITYPRKNTGEALVQI